MKIYPSQQPRKQGSFAARPAHKDRQQGHNVAQPQATQSVRELFLSKQPPLAVQHNAAFVTQFIADRLPRVANRHNLRRVSAAYDDTALQASNDDLPLIEI
jgi:hypothetical protein